MDPVEPIIHSFVIKVWQEVVVGQAGPHGWRGYVTHVPSGARQYFEDLAAIAAFVGPHLERTLWPDDESSDQSEISDGAIEREGSWPVDTQPAIATSVAQPKQRPSRPMPPPERVEMESSPKALQGLMTRLHEVSTAIDSARDSLSKTQDDLKHLTDGQAALQKVVDDLAGSVAAIDKQIASIATPVANALQAHDDVVELLRKDLPEARRTAVTAAVKAIDDDVAAVRAEGDAARDALAEAQRDADLANQESTQRSNALKAAQAALKELPATLQSLQANATKLATGAKAAGDAGHPAAAFVLDGQLASTLAELENLAQPTYTAGLAAAVSDAWTAFAVARSEADTKAAASAAAEGAVNQADADLAAKAGQRDAAIMAKLTELESQWSAPEAPTAAATTAAATTAAATTPAVATAAAVAGQPAYAEPPAAANSAQ